MEQPTPIPAKSTVSAAEPLQYAPRPSSRRRLFRRVLLALASIALAAAAARWGRPAYDLAALLYHQHVCLTYHATADQVVFDSDPAHAAALANDPNFVIAGSCAFRRSPADWQPFKVTPVWMPPTPQAMVFLHERRAVGGTPRLVAIERDAGPDCLAFSASVLEPAGISRPAKAVTCGLSSNVGDTTSHFDTRFFAGQPDPADPSHFTIRFERAGTTHLIDGYLLADNSITLTQRDKPADRAE
jgi:hypothetical protein